MWHPERVAFVAGMPEDDAGTLQTLLKVLDVLPGEVVSEAHAIARQAMLRAQPLACGGYYPGPSSAARAVVVLSRVLRVPGQDGGQ